MACGGRHYFDEIHYSVVKETDMVGPPGLAPGCAEAAGFTDPLGVFTVNVPVGATERVAGLEPATSAQAAPHAASYTSLA